MSKVAIQGNASGTGTFTIAAPNSNTDRTLTLPDEAGTVLTSGGAIDVNASAPADSVAIDASGNVGIGTSSPTAPLHIYSASANRPLIESNSTSQAGLILKNTDKEFRILNGSSSLSVYDQTSNAERMRIDSSGNVMIGTTSADSSVLNVERDTHSVYGLKVEQTAGTVNFTINELIRVAIQSANAETPLQRFVAGGSTFGLIRINSTNNGTQYLTTSDYRLKENVVDMTDSVTRLKQLRPVNYNFIGNDITTDGFLAHEVQAVVPTAVAGAKDAVDEDGNINPQMIEMQSMVPLLTSALQEAIARIETLEAEVATLKGASA